MKSKGLVLMVVMSLWAGGILHTSAATVVRGGRLVGQAARSARSLGRLPTVPEARVFRAPIPGTPVVPLQGPGVTVRSNFFSRGLHTERATDFTSRASRFHFRDLNHPLLFLGAGAGVGLTTLWFQDHPEEWNRLFSRPLSSRFELDHPPVCTDQTATPEEVSRAVIQGGYLEVLRESFFGSSQASKMDQEVPDFYNRTDMNDLKVSTLKQWFNEQHSDEDANVEEQDVQRGSFLHWFQKLSPSKDQTRLEQIMKSTGLREEEVLSLYMYTLDSDELNSKLRRGAKGDHFPKTIKETIDSALKKLAQNQPLPPETQLYRGTALPRALFQQIREKMTFSDPAYLSTSLSVEAAQGFFKESDDEREKILFVIEGQKSAVSIKPFSSYSDQDEVVFPSATSFQVKSMKKDESQGYWVVHLEEKK